MKKVFLILTVIIASSCIKTKTISVLNKKEWSSIATNSFITKGNHHHLYYKYLNTNVKEIIYKLYNTCTYLGYEANDSIAKYILNRKDKIISCKLNKIFNMNYVRDTIDFKISVLYLSEPFYVDKNLICFSITDKESGKIKWSNVYFLKKQNNALSLIMLYDIINDKFYKIVSVR